MLVPYNAYYTTLTCSNTNSKGTILLRTNTTCVSVRILIKLNFHFQRKFLIFLLKVEGTSHWLTKLTNFTLQ